MTRPFLIQSQWSSLLPPSLFLTWSHTFFFNILLIKLWASSLKEESVPFTSLLLCLIKSNIKLIKILQYHLSHLINLSKTLTIVSVWYFFTNISWIYFNLCTKTSFSFLSSDELALYFKIRYINSDTLSYCP